jgi:hypothetical protein
MNYSIENLRTIYVSFSLPFIFGAKSPDTSTNHIDWKNIRLINSVYFTDAENYQDPIHTTDLAKYNQNHYSKVLKNLDNNNIRHLIIVTVTKNPLISSIMTLNIRGDGYNSILKNYIVPFRFFFTVENINRFICKREIYIEKEARVSYSHNRQKWNTMTDEINAGFTIFKFENTTYLELVSEFHNLNINISGGASVKRQILSLVQTKLCVFIFALEGENAFKKIHESFNTHKIITNTHFDFNTKKGINQFNLFKEELNKIQISEETDNDLNNLNNSNNYNNSNKSNNSNNFNKEPNNNNNNNNIKSNNNNPFNSKEQKRDFHSTIKC